MRVYGDGSIALQKWREMHAIWGGLPDMDAPEMEERVWKEIEYTSARTDEPFPSPELCIDPEDYPVIREACENTLAVKGLTGAYMRIAGIKRAAKKLVSVLDSNADLVTG